MENFSDQTISFFLDKNGSPYSWLILLESKFKVLNLTTSSSKFHYVISSLPSDILKRLSFELIEATNNRDPYNFLKQIIIEKLKPAPKEIFSDYFNNKSLADKKPSIVLKKAIADLEEVQPYITEDNQEILRLCFLSFLPECISRSLYELSNVELNELALRADKLYLKFDHLHLNNKDLNEGKSVNGSNSEVQLFLSHVIRLERKIDFILKKLDIKYDENSSSDVTTTVDTEDIQKTNSLSEQRKSNKFTDNSLPSVQKKFIKKPQEKSTVVNNSFSNESRTHNVPVDFNNEQILTPKPLSFSSADSIHSDIQAIEQKNNQQSNSKISNDDVYSEFKKFEKSRPKSKNSAHAKDGRYEMDRKRSISPSRRRNNYHRNDEQNNSFRRRSQRTPSPPSNVKIKNLCFYHTQYGDDAQKCQLGCTWEKKSSKLAIGTVCIFHAKYGQLAKSCVRSCTYHEELGLK